MSFALSRGAQLGGARLYLRPIDVNVQGIVALWPEELEAAERRLAERQAAMPPAVDPTQQPFVMYPPLAPVCLPGLNSPQDRWEVTSRTISVRGLPPGGDALAIGDELRRMAEGVGGTGAGRAGRQHTLLGTRAGRLPAACGTPACG